MTKADAQSNLIDTILNGYPLPKMFLSQKTDLKTRINAALSAIKESGSYEKITKAYSDYGILPP